MKVRFCLLLILSFLLTNCSTKVVGIYNYNVTHKKPDTFLVYSAGEYTSLSPDNEDLDSQLQQIISNSLLLKGLKDSSIPDIYVSYIISVNTSSETQRNNNSPYTRYYYDYSYNYSTRNYKEGVLIIDVKNDDNKLIWQGSKTFKVKSKQSVEVLLPEICREIMTAYNIEGKQ